MQYSIFNILYSIFYITRTIHEDLERKDTMNRVPPSNITFLQSISLPIIAYYPSTALAPILPTSILSTPNYPDSPHPPSSSRNPSAHYLQVLGVSITGSERSICQCLKTPETFKSNRKAIEEEYAMKSYILELFLNLSPKI